MGNHDILLGGLEDCERYLNAEEGGTAVVVRGVPPPPTRIGGGTTANFLRMWSVWKYIHAASKTLPGDGGKARQELLDVLKLERETGLMSFGGRIEQTCADPHLNMHLYPMLLLWWAARVFSDSEVENLVATWLRQLFDLAHLCSVPNGQVRWPMTRCEMEPAKGSDVITICHRLVYWLPQRGNMKSRSHSAWASRYFNSARLLAALLESDDHDQAIIGATSWTPWGPGDDVVELELPKLAIPMDVYWSRSDIIASLRKTRMTFDLHDQVVDWVASTAGGLTFGRHWSVPPPMPSRLHLRTTVA